MFQEFFRRTGKIVGVRRKLFMRTLNDQKDEKIKGRVKINNSTNRKRIYISFRN